MARDSLYGSSVFRFTSFWTNKLPSIVSKDSKEESSSSSSGSDLVELFRGGFCLNIASWMHFH